MKRYYTTKEVAEQLGLTPSDVRKWVHIYGIPIKVTGKIWRFTPEQVTLIKGLLLIEVLSLVKKETEETFLQVIN